MDLPVIIARYLKLLLGYNKTAGQNMVSSASDGGTSPPQHGAGFAFAPQGVTRVAVGYSGL